MSYPNSSENVYDNGHINNQKLFSSRMDTNIYSQQNDTVPQRRNEIFMESYTNIGSRTSQDQYYNEIKNSSKQYQAQHQNMNIYSNNRTPIPIDRPVIADENPRIKFNEKTMVQYNPTYNEANYNQNNVQKSKKTIFAPDSITNDLSKLEIDIENEYEQFEREERQRRKEFEDRQKKKKEYIQNQINNFETEYNPYEILDIHKSEATIEKVKKQYKKMALKYHPDKAGSKYEGKFQLITQSYIYLLSKLEEEDQQKNKMNQKVSKKTYENDLNDGKVNVYIDKDKFDINKFNEIFEKYKIPDVHDDGYGDLMNGKDNSKSEENAVFGKNFNQAIFNAHFDELKKKKGSTDVVTYREPEALDLNNMGFSELGVSKVNDYSSSVGSLGYSDYKKAHIDETLLINPNSVKYKQYKDVNQLESERSNISFQASREEKEYRERMERKRQEDEANRLHQMKMRDSMVESQYNKMNRKLIINK